MFMRVVLFLATMFMGVSATPVRADGVFKSTPYPVPRYVSIAKNEAYVRTGPGHKFPIKFVYEKRGLPVEIILEYETWRKIRDRDGDGGWVHQSLLSGKRTGIITAAHPRDKIVLFNKDNAKSQKMALLEQGVTVALTLCDPRWCKVNAQGYKGWVRRKNIWGVYDSENFD